ncbi:hypothetical protein MNB_SV-13-1128 [hydrothermal vent metagenome]|uniref:Uncharacterized protein n=1 Tax=hydrothermal vent metagenome TaxID=652676 RepID=A0A1W1CL65_9ZZZZ
MYDSHGEINGKKGHKILGKYSCSKHRTIAKSQESTNK